MLSEARRAYKRDYNALLKANHLCRDCKAQDGHTLGGYTLCWDCQERANMAQNKRRQTENYKAHRRMKAKALYDERKAKGLCPECGRKPEVKRFIFCAYCRALKRKAKEKAEVKRRITEDVNWPRGDNGYCWRCNRQQSLDGKRLCADCYEQQLGLLKRARSAKEVIIYG